MKFSAVLYHDTYHIVTLLVIYSPNGDGIMYVKREEMCEYKAILFLFLFSFILVLVILELQLIFS